MGWANCGEDNLGRPIGYAHKGICDHPDCEAEIDRGLSYACGGMHGDDEHSCEGYFCYAHLVFAELSDGERVQLCEACTGIAEANGDLADEETPLEICGR